MSGRPPSGPRGRPVDVVVASLDAVPGDVFDHLLRLVGRLRAAGLNVEVVLVGDGERLTVLESFVPVTVVDRFRRHGVAVVPWLFRMRHVSGAMKSVRLKGWVRRHRDVPWIVHHPTASSMLRFAAVTPPLLVACLPDVGMVPGDLPDADLITLAPAALWLTRSADQAQAITASGSAGAMVVGSLADPRAAPPPDLGPLPVVLVPSSPSWDLPNHTAEVALHIAATSGAAVQWVVHGEADRWLAQHDLDRLGLERAGVVEPAGADLAGARLVVRTGYGGDGWNLCLEAAELGVPVVGFDLPPGLGEPADRFEPFAVSGLLQRVDELVPDAVAAASARRRADRRSGELERLAAQIGELVALIRQHRAPER